MSIAKVIEVLAQDTTIEGAVETALAEASESVRNIQSIYVKDIQGVVKDGSITAYRVNCKVTFVVGG
jgi:hypothetical protein